MHTDRKQQMQELTDKLEQGIEALFESDRYRDYLQTMAKFHRYSYRNTMLILMQRPEATLVAGFQSWKQKFQRHVKKGETGIAILAPMSYKRKKKAKEKDPEVFVSESEQEEIVDAPEEAEEETQMIVGFRVVKVFDLAQTEGKELPQLAVDELTGTVTDYPGFLQALFQVAPFPVSFEEITDGAKGYCDVSSHRIVIRKAMSELQTVKTALHEIAHAMLHVDAKEKKDAATREVEAESTAYVVCQYFGLDTSDYSFGYVAGWGSGRKMPELKASLHTIQTTAAELIEQINQALQESKNEE